MLIWGKVNLIKNKNKNNQPPCLLSLSKIQLTKSQLWDGWAQLSPNCLYIERAEYPREYYLVDCFSLKIMRLSLLMITLPQMSINWASHSPLPLANEPTFNEKTEIFAEELYLPTPKSVCFPALYHPVTMKEVTLLPSKAILSFSLLPLLLCLYSLLSPGMIDPRWLLELSASRLHSFQQEKEGQRQSAFSL